MVWHRHIPAAFAAAVLTSATAFAEDAEDSAELVTAFAEAVYAGESIAQFGFSPALSEEDLAAVGGLAGCTPEVAEQSSAILITLDWTCENAPERERHTGIGFYEEGGSHSLWVNPSERNFTATEAGLATEDLPSPRRLARDFARAVREGEDPTLGGLIPLTPEQLATLAQFDGLDFNYGSGNSNHSQTAFWDSHARHLPQTLNTDLRFDDDGRPIGLLIHGTIRVRTGARW